jgi:hypothetical protein
VQYLDYAQQHPLEYRLMFSTTWPERPQRTDLVRDATHAFDVLRGVLRRLHGERRPCDARGRWTWMRCTSGRRCTAWPA